MPSVKGLDPLEASSADIYLPLEEGLKQVVERAKANNPISLKYLTESMLGVITAPKGRI